MANLYSVPVTLEDGRMFCVYVEADSFETARLILDASQKQPLEIRGQLIETIPCDATEEEMQDFVDKLHEATEPTIH